MADNNAAVIVESQPTVVHPEKMNEKQRDRWLRTGEHPEIKPKEAASAPAAPKAESQPAREESKPKTAADRVQELLKERHELRAELEKLRTAPKAESQPAAIKTAKAEELKGPEKPKRPDLIQFSTTAEYDHAMDGYDQAMEEYSFKKQAFEDATKRAKEAQQKLETSLKTSWERVQTKYPDAKDKSNPIFTALLENQPAMPQVTWFLNNTDVLPDMLYAMGGQFKVDEFIELAKTSEPKAIRLLVQMEKDIIDELAKSAVPKEEEIPRESKKKVTQAPPPPREVGGQVAAMDDPIKSGVANAQRAADGTRYLSDSFMENANKRDIARRQRGK